MFVGQRYCAFLRIVLFSVNILCFNCMLITVVLFYCHYQLILCFILYFFEVYSIVYILLLLIALLHEDY